jgi:hypothetical protein
MIMKKIFFAILFAGLLSSGTLAQGTQFYGSGASEMIFSFAAIENQGNDQGNILRWSPVFNIQGYLNLDFANTIGFFTGLGIRNVGFIYDIPNSNVKMKYRTYNLGVPVGLKLGKLDFMFLFAGYEIEFPFHYKEKKFENEIKEKFGVWFSDRVEPVQHTLMAGIQFPFGMDIKFKYYLTNFHNKDYVELVDGVEQMPYQYLNTNIMYLSLAWNMFTNPRSYGKKGVKKTAATIR